MKTWLSPIPTPLFPAGSSSSCLKRKKKIESIHFPLSFSDSSTSFFPSSAVKANVPFNLFFRLFAGLLLLRAIKSEMRSGLLLFQGERERRKKESFIQSILMEIFPVNNLLNLEKTMDFNPYFTSPLLPPKKPRKMRSRRKSFRALSSFVSLFLPSFFLHSKKGKKEKEGKTYKEDVT